MIPLHGIASRGDLPLPFELVLAGAAGALVVTFWVALFAWRTPRFRDQAGIELPRLTRVVDSPWFSRPLRIAVGLVWLVAALALSFGQDRIDNPVFGFVYVLVWVGLVPVSLLFGGVYRRTNPLRLLLRFTGATAPPGSRPGGSRLPAAAALLGFLYLELVQPDGATLPVLRGFAAAWVAWVVAGVLVRGQTWIARGDPFEAYASAIARVSPWARTRRGVLLLVNPLRNLASWHPPRHLAVLAAVLLGGTLFDALSNTSWWVRATQDLAGWATWLASTAGLLGAVTLIGVLFHLGTRPYRGLGPDQLAPGLIPLVAGYALAHYGTMLYLDGQRTLFRFSDPLGQGWDLFGLAEAAPATGLFAYPTAIAVAQVLTIVTGHVAGVLVTHDIALRSGEQRVAVHVPLLAVMVVFTVGGLTLMFGG